MQFRILFLHCSTAKASKSQKRDHQDVGNEVRDEIEQREEENAAEKSDPKKRKLNEEDYRLERIAKKIIEDSNEILALTDFEKRVDRSLVTVTYDEKTEKISAKVQCVICRQKKMISLVSTKYSATISNFKRHISTSHLKKTGSSQSTLDSFLAQSESNPNFSAEVDLLTDDEDGK